MELEEGGYKLRPLFLCRGRAFGVTRQLSASALREKKTLMGQDRLEKLAVIPAKLKWQRTKK